MGWNVPGGDFLGGNFPRGIFQGGGGREFDGWEFSEVGGGFPGRIFLEPILILNLAESVIMTNRLHLL